MSSFRPCTALSGPRLGDLVSEWQSAKFMILHNTPMDAKFADPATMTCIMADVCIIYASPSKKMVRALDAALSRHWSVWWDDKIAVGDYRAEIERELAQAKCVIAVWCRVSRADEDVVDEAEFVKKRKIPLISVRAEAVDAPLGFGARQRVDLIGWDGDPGDPQIELLIRRIASVIPQRVQLLSRPATTDMGGKNSSLPALFYSVSSHETQLRPDEAVRALALFGARTILVSAYDVAKGDSSVAMIEALERCRSAGSIVLLDSGNYEASRKADRDWSPEYLRRALNITPHDLAFCFDDLESPQELDVIVRRVVDAVERDAKHTNAPMLPIVHAPRSIDGGYASDVLPEVMKMVARELKPPLLAVPERELGSGVLTRAKAVLNIRRSLDELGFYQPLHLLGTGNPITIAVMTAAGADSFDGLEWCRVVADTEDGRLYHFQHYDFFAYQSELAVSSVTREAVSNEGINYAGKVIFHNLDFFAEWMGELRRVVLEGKLDRFLTENLPKGSMRQLERALPEVL